MKKSACRKSFLINDEGVIIGPTPTPVALKMAQDADLDLAIMNPKAVSPIAKMVNLGQLKYESEEKSPSPESRSEKN